MDAFLETYKLSRLKQEEIDNINRPITSNEIETVIKNTQKQESRVCLMDSQEISTKQLKKK